jgi:flagellar hook-associated protein 1 FlgK
MSLLGIFSIAQTAMVAQKVAIEVTSENIANVNTPGYSRQRTIMVTAPTTTANGLPLGTGVRVSQVQRSYDDMLQKLLKTENSTYGEASAEQTAMTRVEQLFNDLTSTGLGKSMQDYFNAWQDLSVNPQGSAERQAVLSTGKLVSDNFNQINTYLTDVKTQANQSLEGLTSDVNDKLKTIASLNVQIQQTENMNGNANELRDQRDLLVRDLAQKVGIEYREEDDKTVTLTLASGETLVSANLYGEFSLQDNAGKYDISLRQAGSATGSLVDLSGAKGEIAGTLKVRDSIVDGYLSKLDELAYNLANEVNALHSSGYGTDGSTGKDFFSPPAGMSGYSGLISVDITDPAAIAAADADPTLPTSGIGNNANALKLAALKTAKVDSSFGSISLSSFYNSLVGSVGVGVQDTERALNLSGSVLKQLDNLRESQSGVSLDEEMMGLIKYQKAFEGSAKLITTATEMLDTVLGLVR